MWAHEKEWSETQHTFGMHDIIHQMPMFRASCCQMKIILVPSSLHCRRSPLPLPPPLFHPPTPTPPQLFAHLKWECLQCRLGSQERRRRGAKGFGLFPKYMPASFWPVDYSYHSSSNTISETGNCYYCMLTWTAFRE